MLGQGFSEECLERVSKVGVSHLEVVRQLAEDLDRGLVHDLLRLLDFRGEDGREGVSDVEGALPSPGPAPPSSGAHRPC